MGIFEPVEKGLKEIDDLASLYLSPSVTVVECVNPGVLASRIENLAPQGRPVIRWDAKTFRKDDSTGSMYALYLLHKEPKPIVIIENIADIPDGDRSIYDDPVLVENVLLHSWKNDTIRLTHKGDSFQLNSGDYTVIFLVKPGDLLKLHHVINGEGFGLVTFVGQ